MNQTSLFVGPQADRSAYDTQIHETGSATFSADGRHRYTLVRRLTPPRTPTRRVLFVMLNPSTADASIDDPTIRRCIGFAKLWGYDWLDVANLFSLRSTDPKALYPDPIEAAGGDANDAAIGALVEKAHLVVCAWGVHGALWSRGDHVRRFVIERSSSANIMAGLGIRAAAIPHHLGLTKDGHPKHPLYLRGDTKPQPWSSL